MTLPAALQVPGLWPGIGIKQILSGKPPACGISKAPEILQFCPGKQHPVARLKSDGQGFGGACGYLLLSQPVGRFINTKDDCVRMKVGNLMAAFTVATARIKHQQAAPGNVRVQHFCKFGAHPLRVGGQGALPGGGQMAQHLFVQGWMGAWLIAAYRW